MLAPVGPYLYREVPDPLMQVVNHGGNCVTHLLHRQADRLEVARSTREAGREMIAVC